MHNCCRVENHESYDQKEVWEIGTLKYHHKIIDLFNQTCRISITM